MRHLEEQLLENNCFNAKPQLPQNREGESVKRSSYISILPNSAKVLLSRVKFCGFLQFCVEAVALQAVGSHTVASETVAPAAAS
ncbi:MAG: hypothetical protein H7099_19925 [Gemmatimonadaceae bacterium]|nr:hypothetical protein [Gemmatimonadaceae bacterium]